MTKTPRNSKIAKPIDAPVKPERSLLLTDEFVSKNTARITLAVGMTKLDELIASGSLVSAKIGRRRLISARSLNSYMAVLLAETAPPVPQLPASRLLATR